MRVYGAYRFSDLPFAWRIYSKFLKLVTQLGQVQRVPRREYILIFIGHGAHTSRPSDPRNYLRAFLVSTLNERRRLLNREREEKEDMQEWGGEGEREKKERQEGSRRRRTEKRRRRGRLGGERSREVKEEDEDLPEAG